MALSEITKITGAGIATDTNWVGNNANFTGITTAATSFNIGVTTIHSTLIEAHNIKSTGIITATGGSFSGNVTAVDGTFSGNVSIAGTLTYEDVTNIDSVGVITARSNIDCNGSLDVDGHTNLDNVSVAGISTFSGIVDAVNTPASIRVAQDIQHKGDANTKISFPANDEISFDTSGHDRIYIKSDGKIGMGTVTPAVNIHHFSDGLNGNSIRLENREGYVTIINDANGLYLDADTHYIRSKAGSTYATINSSGKATFTTPGGDDAFLVKGDNYTSVRIQSARDSASDHAMFQMLGSRGTNASPTIVQSGDTLGTLSARGYDGNSYASSSNINFGVDGTPGDGDMPGRITFSTAADGSESPTEKLRITSTGRVGINSTNPSAPLEIYTAASAAWKFRIDTTVSDGVGFYQRANGDFELVLRDASNNVNYIAGTSGALQFATAGSERLRIASDGRVYIGNTQDSSPYSWNLGLQVSGTSTNAGLSLRRDQSGSGGALLMFVKTGGALNGNTAPSDGDQIGGIYFNAADGTDVNNVAARISGTIDGTPGSNNTPGRLTFATTADGANSPTERLRIDSAGDIFIGTSTDIAPTNGTNLCVSDATISRLILEKQSTIKYGLNVSSGFTIYDETNDAARFSITSDGYVGSGESSPKTGLSIGQLGDYQTTDGNTYYMPVGKWSSTWNAVNAINNATDYWVGFVGGYLKTNSSVNISLAPNRSNTGQQAGMYISGEATGNSSADFTVGKIVGGSATGSGTSGNVRATKSELFRITSSGQLLQGETSTVDSNTAIQFRKDVVGNQARFIFRNRGNNSNSRVQIQAMTLNRAANADVFSGIEKYQNGGMAIYNGENTNQYSNINFFTNGWRSLQLRNGNHSGAWCAEIDAYWGTSNGLRMEVGGPQSGTWQAIDFHTSHTGTQRGYIGVTYGGVSYNSSSDYRMKQNVVDLTSAIDRVKSLKPKRFRWKEDLTHTVDGFLAHEAQTVVPESVQGEKDGEQMQVMDNSKLVPVLTAALKEAITKIETLETKVAALEGS